MHSGRHIRPAATSCSAFRSRKEAIPIGSLLCGCEEALQVDRRELASECRSRSDPVPDLILLSRFLGMCRFPALADTFPVLVRRIPCSSCWGMPGYRTDVTSISVRGDGLNGSITAKFPVFSLFNKELPPETGSQQTTCTARCRKCWRRGIFADCQAQTAFGFKRYCLDRLVRPVDISDDPLHVGKGHTNRLRSDGYQCFSGRTE